jgi:Family of unknown function (DUF5320)
MPSGDRSGPMGQGSGTGRAVGLCYGFDTPGYTKGSGGRMGNGFGRGRGRGRGFNISRGRNFGFTNMAPQTGNPWMQSMSREDEVRMLKTQADDLARSQNDIEKRLGELEKEAE